MKHLARPLHRPWVATVIGLLAGAALCARAHAATPLLLRNPSLSQERIAFLYADDIWTVAREGGEARRLTSDGNITAGPFFSPDFTQIAYSAKQAGGTDIYVIRADGGVPRRLTWDPEGALVRGWTPDGRDVVFASQRISHAYYERLFRIHANGEGSAEAIPVPTAAQGSISPDGKTLAYVPVMQWQKAWKRYRGGQTTPIWLVDLASLDLEQVPRENSNDSYPVWDDTTVYFLSDRDGPVSLYSYDTRSKQVEKRLDNTSFDFKSLGAGPGALVYEQFGSLHLYDLNSRQAHAVSITLRGDLPQLAPHLVKVSPKELQNVSVSPSGARIAVEAQGDIFTLPAEKGDIRNLTRTAGAAERDPSWSPDGRRIAYFSDASGEYQLHIRDQDGIQPPVVIDLGPQPSFFYTPRWSPDSRKIAYADKHLRIWYVDVNGGKPVKVDAGVRGGFGNIIELAWSPDSQWLAYTRDLDRQVRAIFLHSLASHASTQLTDGLSDAAHPAFDASGEYLYFTASTDSGPSNAGIDLSSLDRATRSGVYVTVLSAKGGSPVPPESDDEHKKDETPKQDAAVEPAAKKPADKPKATVVDLAGIGNRILPLPVPERNYVDLSVGKAGVLFLAEGAPVGRPSDEPETPRLTLWRFTTEKRQTEQMLNGVTSYKVSFDGTKLFYARQENWFLAPTEELKPGAPDAAPGKPVNNAGMSAMLDLRAQWRQMFRETWRLQRDFLYDPHYHGLDLAKAQARYEPFLDGLASRAEFTYLSEEMLGELQLGHVFVRGPRSDADAPRSGALGADFSVDGDRYRFAKIYNGQNWTPSLSAPLTLPGVNIVSGDYLLAVNGRELHARDNIEAFFEGTAGRQTVLRIAKRAQGDAGREVTVVPLPSAAALRNLDWIESNRRKVDALSGGRIAYAYMPDTGGAGFSNFNRHLYSQLDKQGLVLDERYNGGGFIADYVINLLGQKRMSGAIERDGKPLYDPVGAIYGPKAMIINESAGSGGDAMPWYFRKAKIGTLVGTRTWGGLVGIGGYPTLIDGGSVTAPRYAIYGLDGQWEVEGNGIAPDVEVREWPKDVAAGHDAQLESAVAIVLRELAAHPIVEPKIPPYPNHHRDDDLGAH